MARLGDLRASQKPGDFTGSAQSRSLQVSDMSVGEPYHIELLTMRAVTSTRAPGILTVFIFTFEICSHELEVSAQGDFDAYGRNTTRHMFPTQ
jgi:hypothetical protein